MMTTWTLDPVALLIHATDEATRATMDRDRTPAEARVLTSALVTLGNAVEYLRTGNIRSVRGFAGNEQAGELLFEAVKELRARGVDATWEYPGNACVGEWFFGFDDGQLTGNTQDEIAIPAEGLRQDLTLPDAIQNFIDGIQNNGRTPEHCPKCGKPVTRADAFEDAGTGEEAGRTFYYCSEHCREAH